MHLNEKGILSEDISISISEKSQSEVDARLFFMQNKIDPVLLKKMLIEASLNGDSFLELSKKSQIRRVIHNPYVDYDLKQLIDKNIIDKSRIEALEIIKNFKSTKTGE